MSGNDFGRRILAGERLALARLLTRLENGDPEGQAALAELYPHTGRAHLVGITGPPGVGKSTLVNSLARHYRQPPDGAEPRTVAVVAVDPTSPFTGGAILGDRIRMRELAGDPGVFIRSMATRGALGGLARATTQVIQALDAAGYKAILVETVGAGQSEVDIASAAHTTVVVEAPGMGDEVQAIKAGLLEIADVLVVNKSDLPGAENTLRALRGMLGLAHPVRRGANSRSAGLAASDAPIWITPILQTVAGSGGGIPALLEAIDSHRVYLAATGELAGKERARAAAELEAGLREALMHGWRAAAPDGAFEAALERVLAREIAPLAAVKMLVAGEFARRRP